MSELERALFVLAKYDKLGHLTLAKTHGGKWQGAHRPPNELGYKVAINVDPVDALLESLSPGFRRDWRDHLDNWSDSWDT